MTRVVTSSFFAALLLLIASAPSEAQSLDGPSNVCAGDLFEVDWRGPNASNDAITIAAPQYPADDVFDSSPTSDGSPVELRAPFVPGTYELRYVQFEPQNILAREAISVNECLSGGSGGGTGPGSGSGSGGGSGGGAGGSNNWPLVAVEARGIQIDHGDQINRSGQSPYGGPSGFTIDQLCAAAPQIGQAIQMMADQLEAGMAGSPISIDMIESLPGAPNRADVVRDVRNARDAICNSPPPGTTTQPFIITYAYCRMAMNTPTHAMDIHIPVGRDGTMSMADYQTREVVKMTMRQNFETTTALLGGWGDEIQMNGPGASSSHIGYPTRQYSFDYSGGLGNGPAGIPGVSNTIKVKNSGSGWFSSQVPGIDIIRLFYQRMATEVTTDSGGMSMFGSMINNMVGMLRKGIPLIMDQTTSSSVMGRTMVSGRTQHYITSIKLVDFEPQWCDETLMPPSYPVTDVDAQIAEAMGSSGANNEEMAEAMAQYNEAMQQMTPEQRAMMESMGMGDMMQQAMAAGGAGAASPPAAASNVRPSAALTTNNLTQSVQLHLNALGYDVGNTKGEESLATSIAISQYQAERRLAVTGEVSAELLRTLSAEIDGG